MQLLKILLISTMAWSCQMITKQYEMPGMTLNIADDDEQVFRPFEIIREDRKTCKFVVEDKKVKVPYVNRPINGGACLTPEDYQKWREFRRKQCEQLNKR